MRFLAKNSRLIIVTTSVLFFVIHETHSQGSILEELHAFAKNEQEMADIEKAELLSHGALPLDVLEEMMMNWISSKGKLFESE